MTCSKIVGLLASLVISVVFLWLVVSLVSFEGLLQVFAGAKLVWLVAAFLAFLIAYAIRIERWRLILCQYNPQLTWRQCAGPFFLSAAVNNILPLRAGDIIRVVAFNGKLGVTNGVSIFTLLYERALDLMTLLGFLGLTLWLFERSLYPVLGVGGFALSVVALMLAFILIFPNTLRPLVNLVEVVMRRALAWMRMRVEEQGRIDGVFLGHLSERTLTVKLLILSTLAWIAEGFVFWFTALAFPLISEPVAAWLALALGTLSTVIPSTPGFIGTFDYFTAQAMIIMGNEAVVSVAYAFTVHALLLIPTILFGGIYFSLHPMGAFWTHKRTGHV